MTDTDSFKSNKREASQLDMDDCEGPSKRPRSGGRAVDVRFLVQSKNAGAIIGKGGSNINRLRTEFTASVTVPDCPGPERILAVVADTETLGEILLDILPKLDDYSHHHNMEFDCELRMLLHQSHAGCLIGKGGSRIKELREKTGAQIKIFSNCCPNSTERIVQITGYPNVVVDCVKEICHIVSTAPIKGANKQYDPHHFNPMFCSDYGGFEDTGPKGRGGGRGGFRGRPSGPPAWRDEAVDNFSFGGGPNAGGRGRGGFGSNFTRGRGIMGQGPNMGNRWSQMSGGSGPSNPVGGGGGGNQGGWGAASGGGNFGNRMMGNMNGANQGNFMPQQEKPMGPGMGGPRPPMMNPNMGFQGGAGGPGMNGPAPRFMGSGGPVRPMKPPGYVQPVPNTGELFSSKPIANPSNGMYSIVMKIPNDVAGAIIGKGGQRIRKIRRDSNVNINIDEATQGSNDRIITITGPLQQAQMAHFLMQQSVRENQGGGGGGGPGRRF